MIKIFENKPMFSILSYVPFVAMILNNYCYNKIENKLLAINNFLKKYELQLHEISWYDCAPCEVEYSIIQDADRGLSPFDFYLMIKEANRMDSIHHLKCECEKIQSKYLAKLCRKQQL